MQNVCICSTQVGTFLKTVSFFVYHHAEPKRKKKGRKQFYTVLTEVKEKVQAQGSVKDGSGSMWGLKAFFTFLFHFEGSLYRGSFPYILKGGAGEYCLPRTSLYKSSLHRGSSVVFFFSLRN